MSPCSSLAPVLDPFPQGVLLEIPWLVLARCWLPFGHDRHSFNLVLVPMWLHWLRWAELLLTCLYFATRQKYTKYTKYTNFIKKIQKIQNMNYGTYIDNKIQKLKCLNFKMLYIFFVSEMGCFESVLVCWVYFVQ